MLSGLFAWVWPYDPTSSAMLRTAISFTGVYFDDHFSYGLVYGGRYMVLAALVNDIAIEKVDFRSMAPSDGLQNRTGGALSE